jgi:hypothetical protein
MEISVSNASVQNIPPCVWTFIGSLNNTGELKVYDVNMSIKMIPARAGYKEVSKYTLLYDIAPGTVRPFSFIVTVVCEGNYRAELRWDGVDIKNPKIDSDDVKVSGTKTL